MYSFAGTLQSLAITLLVAIAFLRMVAKLLGGRQARLLYHPDMPANSRSIVPDPADYGLTHEKIEIQCPDGVRLRSYFIQGQQLSSITLIHFHGNAGNIGHRIPLAQLLIERLGVNVVLAEYRGYGFSDTPESITEEGIMMDAVATLEHVRHLPYVNPHGIIAHGSSLGGAVCIDLALRHAEKLAAVIVENTFTSISDMTDVLLAQILSHQQLSQNRRGALSVVVSALLKPVVLTINWRSIDKVSQLRCPILFVSGAEDELVPKEHMVRLYTACRSSVKKLASIPGGRHNETFTLPQTMAEMRDYINDHVRQAVTVHDTGSVPPAPPSQASSGHSAASFTRTASGQGMSIRTHSSPSGMQ